MLPLAFQMETFPCEVCTFSSRKWNFLQGLYTVLELFFFFSFGFQGRLGNADEQVAPSSLPRYFWLIAFSSTTRWLDAGTENTLCNTWSTVCCLRRICSRVDRFWFRDSWSDCIAAAAEASTWLFSSSPSSWRTISESCVVFKSTSRSCGNTLNKDRNS